LVRLDEEKRGGGRGLFFASTVGEIRRRKRRKNDGDLPMLQLYSLVLVVSHAYYAYGSPLLSLGLYHPLFLI
jgi:hypothetical protein